MTKEQWLENMLSENPDYKGLIELKDQELLSYIMNYFTDHTPNDFINENSVCCKFMANVLDTEDTDFILTESDEKWLSSLEK